MMINKNTLINKSDKGAKSGQNKTSTHYRASHRTELRVFSASAGIGGANG